MKYYSSGEFAGKAHITKKTVRYYDEHGVLKPSYVNEHGARFYSEEDFARLQQVLFLKYIGFSLDDIKEMNVRSGDRHFLSESLHMQLGLLDERIEQMKLMKAALAEASAAVDRGESVDWSGMLDVVNLNELEQRLKDQYRNSSNIAARIGLHNEFSQNSQGWFPWVYEQCGVEPGMRVLELGCGDASLWTDNIAALPEDARIVLTDVSDGMVRDAKRNVGDDGRFEFRVTDACDIDAEDGSFDLVIADHVLFYCADPAAAAREARRVLKPGGRFVCSTYGADHMREVSELMRSFDDRIVLSAERLYERFGRENGGALLGGCFDDVEWRQYDDCLVVTEAEPLIEYVLSCHGNQNRFIVDKYKEFKAFVRKRTDAAGGFQISKDAGVFVAR